MSIKNVIDSKRNSYEVVRRIGEGSQGTTYLLEGGKYIVKLFNDVMNETQLKSTISFLRRLNLDKEKFALPLAEITQPRIGYISEFASGMVPLSTLKWSNQSDDMNEWFIQTGGMYKRYRVLFKLAEELLTLHSKGLIYCDLSPSNVFISEDSKKDHVFLIDLDNVRYRTSIVRNIYTPFYGAPELVKMTRPNSFESDSYAFGVIAYELLTLSHPLIGDYVSDGEPELEEDALSGKLPWVEHTVDTINKRSSGIPSEFFVSKGLQELFKRTFQDGLNQPDKRPSVSEWHTALNKSLNELIRCPQCLGHYPYMNRKVCPFCGEKTSSLVTLQMRRWEKIESYNPNTHEIIGSFKLMPLIYEEIYIDKYTTKYIKSSHFLYKGNDDDPVIQVKVIEAKDDMRLLEIIPYGGRTFYVAIDETEMFHGNTPKKIRVTGLKHKELIIGIDNLNEPQRVLTIK